MKKFLFMLLAVAGLSGLASAEQTPGRVDDPLRNRDVIAVYNADDVSHSAGSVLVWKDGTTDGLEVSSTTTANNSLVAGVVPYGVTIAAQSYGLLQTSGYHQAIKIGVANSAGDSLVTSTTGEKATPYTILMATATAARGVFATALEATTSSTTVKGFIYRQ